MCGATQPAPRSTAGHGRAHSSNWGFVQHARPSRFIDWVLRHSAYNDPRVRRENGKWVRQPGAPAADGRAGNIAGLGISVAVIVAGVALEPRAEPALILSFAGFVSLGFFVIAVASGSKKGGGRKRHGK